jgi:hypothetical protein
LVWDNSYYTSKTNAEYLKAELFQFIRTLNNLRSISFDFTVFRSTFDISQIPAVMDTIKNIPLQQFSLKISVESEPTRVITAGPTGLDALCIRWDANAESKARNGDFDHLVSLITPSLSSLSCLELYISRNWKKSKSEFDLTLLKAGGVTMRKFIYQIDSDAKSTDAKPIETIAEVFPKLTELALLGRVRAIWTVSIAFYINDQ